MKIILISFAIISVTSTDSIGQNNNGSLVSKNTDYRDKLMFGIRAGANYSNVYDAQGEEFHNDAKFGFAGGLFISIPIGTYLGIQPEILYSQKGFHASGKILGNKYDFKRVTNYIDVPIFISFKPSQYISILVGPQYSYLMSQNDAFETGKTNIAQITEIKNDNIRKNTLSLSGGFDVNVRHLLLGLKGSWDLTNNNGNGTSYTPRYKNSCLQATIGCRI